MEVRTLADLVFRVRELSAGRPKLMTLDLGGRRESLSGSDLVRHVHSLALALEAHGVEKGERVAIYSEGRPEWHVVDLACQLLGAPTVPIDPASLPRQVGYVLRNSGSRWVFYSDRDKRDVLVGLESALTSPLQVVAFEGEAAVPGGVSITRLMGEGAPRLGEIPLERFRGRPAETDLASIVYTNGTTGSPRGVMVSHRQLVASFRDLGEIFALGPEDLALAILPSSHALQRTVDHLCLARGAALYYAPSSAATTRVLRARGATLLAATPRTFEGIHARILARVRRQSAWQRRLFRWAMAVGERHLEATHGGFAAPLLALERGLAALLVYRPIRRQLGGRLRDAIATSGQVAPGISDFFEAVGVPLWEGYGLTEVSPLLTVSTPEDRRRGSVGKALRRVELRLSEDGEILARGPGVAQGYWENPGATAERFDEEGWFRTGDLGHLDDAGRLYVVERQRVK